MKTPSQSYGMLFAIRDHTAIIVVIYYTKNPDDNDDDDTTIARGRYLIYLPRRDRRLS